MASPMTTISLVANVALLALLAVSTVRQPSDDSRVDIEAQLMVRQQSSALDLQRILEQMGRVNRQMKENIDVMGVAKLSLQEALVLEQMRGVPADQAKQILQAVQSLTGNNGDHVPAEAPSSAVAALAAGPPRDKSDTPSRSPSLAPKQEATWLTIGIPTVPRPGGEDYLTRTLQTLLDELPLDATDPLYSNVRVVVMNMAGQDHTVFHGLKTRFEKQLLGDTRAKKALVYVEMMERPALCRDPTPDAPEPNPANNPTDAPGRVARKQTCDVLDLLAVCEGSHYYMFMEDDFETCPHALQMLQYALRKLNAAEQYKAWLALRVSYGLNGIVIRNDDLRRFSEFVRESMARKPIDLLWQEYALHNTEHAAILTRGRELHIYRFNLFAHIGEVSSFPDRPKRKAWPQCYEFMTRAWSLQQNEQFDPKCMDSSDFTPCGHGKARAQQALSGSSDELRRWVNSKLNRPNV